VLLLGGATFTGPTPEVETVDLGTSDAPGAGLDAHRPETVRAFAARIAAHEGRALLVAESPGRRELLFELLRPHGVEPRTVASWAEFASGDATVAITVAPLACGVVLADPPLTIYAEEQLFGDRARQERRRRRSDRDPARIIQQLADLRPGAPVVHEDYGVGRYLGLTTMDAGGMPAEFLVLEYADGDKLYVPVQALERVSRYTGAPAETAPLHKLGSEQWSKARAKAAARIRDAAAELLDVYSRRASRPGHAYDVDEAQLRAFEAGFPFEETADQAAAIEQVLGDLRSAQPMDRVVCGDVGFGKTEVALRAAFVAVQGGKQVAVLVPTTLLAQQHYQTFADRFADWPVKVELLSRFRGDAQAKVALAGLADGKVDIVIGTHRLLQPGVRFKDLGLLVIDEEHRFGVRDKERLKALRAEVDVLTLTATPIPRTLNMALGGLRDLSLITTAPAARLSIKTFVTEWNAPSVRDACLRELRRGGQVYFVHNAVESIEGMAKQLAELVPEARIAVGHGQMRERDLEQVMLDFYHRRANLLLCTTIIESGIDVPTANTMIIDRADRFGLAQLHQLRGRVGRSHHQAYAYLVTPPRNAMTSDAKKRLEAIESLDDLGAGFVLATHDLEIRGAGELLGEGQSGQIQEIGFALYMELLERAVAALRAGKTPELERPLHHGPEIDLHVPALLPDAYLPDVHARLVLYKRISGVGTEAELDDLQAETVDRFGVLPDPAKNLFRIARLRVAAARLGIERLDVAPAGGSVTFAEDTPVDPGALILLVQRTAKTMRFDGPRKLRFTGQHGEAEHRYDAAGRMLAALAGCAPG
jgi:transcription-repair coupling factor (superfamily II helicase)